MARKSRKLSPSEKKCKIFQSSLKEVIRIAKKSGQKAQKAQKSHKKSRFGSRGRKGKKGFSLKKSFNKFMSMSPFKTRFGSGAHGMPQNLLGMMGNTPKTEMSFSQSYTGMSPYQADVHMANTDPALRTLFSPTPVEYNPTYPPEL